jgi:putative membrane protein insertion efficiency factor
VTLPTRGALLLLDIYQAMVAPVLGGACRFAPSCSEYARQAVVEHGALRGAGLALRRLVKCHPFNQGGWDPPPSRQLSK